MTFRSRLFATVALPVLSVSLVATPTLADALMKPFEVAQESSGPTEEELLQQQQEEQRRAAEEEAQRQAEEQQRQAEEQQRAAEEEEQRQAEEQQRQAEEQQRAAEEEAQRQAEEQKAAEAEAQRAAEEEAQRQAEQQKAAEEEAQRAADEEAQRQAEQQKAAEEEAQRAADQQKAADEEAQQAAEQQKAAEEEAQRAAEEQQRQAEEQQKAAEEQQQQTEEQPQQPAEEQQAEQPAGEPQGEQPAVTEEVPAEPATEQPSTAETGEAPVVVVPEVVDTLSEEQKQEIAEDPGKTDETVVLPVENGAAVLDSDKDADNLGGQTSREERRKQREELRAQEEVPLPDSDVSAQAAISEEVREAVPQKIEAAIKEEGKRLDAAPVFEVPQTTNIINNTVINNTVVNNTVNNNVVNNNITRVDVVEKIDNRTVLSVGDRLFVRGDDRPRLRRDSEEVYYDNLARGRTRETIVRPGGVQIVTIYDRYGDIIQRSRVGRDGREYIIAYAPEREDDAPRADFVDVGYELPPMRLRIPLRDYIVDTSSEPDRDYYDFLSEPPVERVERVYTIDEVKHSARLRDKVRRIDLDTITFATGSAEVPMSQARTLRKVAEAMEKVLDKDPGETFLIEGHTDAVGSDKSNLILSDLRAEAVANLLTEVYGIPPENLQTQGYGERFLKVRTDAAEQQNRRVTIRRVTTLVRPVANAN
ncbi:OmpA family protein [Shinella zoogloeoides]|uniref:OmpA family protein n=1 Tax=Shinella zoogloeoides TaxID=352475 RepID=UPI001F597742|nr:OmpA family protein [Shinella zoogloeoides]